MTKLINDTKAFTIGMSIRARVALEWRPRKFDSAEYDGLHYLLVDEEGSSIQAKIEECYYGHVPNLMTVGKVYDISWFGSIKDSARQRISKFDFILSFTAKTEFKQVEQDVPKIPRYAFRFLGFSQLPDEAEFQPLLADLYGCIKAAKEPQLVDVRNSRKKEMRTDIIFMFIGREEIRISLWGDVAKGFPVQELSAYPEPILAAFTGMRITKFEGRLGASSTNHTCIILNPKIPETAQYKTEFSTVGDKVKVLGAYSKLTLSAEINEADKRTVAELKTLHPTIHASKSVYCVAVVARFFVEKGWWYNSCSHEKCYKVMLKNEEEDDKYFCSVHGQNKPKKSYRVFMIIEDDHDQANLTLMGRSAEEFFNATCEQLLEKRLYPTEGTLPPEISSKVGEKFLFEISINQRGQFFLRASLENQTAHKKVTANEEFPQDTETEEPTLDTPLKVPTGKKRVNKTAAKKLFLNEMTKKTAKDGDDGSSAV